MKISRGVCALVVAVVGGLSIVGCAAEVVAPTTPPQIRIQTAAAPTQVCLTARVSGTLVADPRWGVGFRQGPGAPVIKIVFPYGYHAFATAPAIPIVDERGRLVANVGDSIDTAGGWDNRAAPLNESVSICGLDPV